MSKQLSLDELERAEWHPGPAPFESPFVAVKLAEGAIADRGDGVRVQSLNGGWEMAPDGYADERTDITRDWADKIACPVPCGVHTALYEAGIIEDPLFAKNDKRAREWTYHVWWFKRVFDLEEGLVDPRLSFDGVCYSAHFWLNGHYLGTHRGMFGGPFYAVKDLLKEKGNVLIVRIDNAPTDPMEYSEYADFDDGWSSGVVVNCVYGWHYACIPSRGIWAPVQLVSRPNSYAEKPFLAVLNEKKGIVDLCCKLTGKAGKGRIYVSVTPTNFEGKSYHFEEDYTAVEGETQLHYRMEIPDPQLWWPNGIGPQNLYTVQIWIEPENDLVQHFEEHIGLRTVKMEPLPGGPYADKHNWTFVVNGRKVFVKGTNWCTTDALLRFPNERYDRFLGLAKAQGLQLLRAWGGGMPESDYFYDTCDRLGLMVFQEWPTCWGSQRKQPMGELLETVILATIRIRNHPSLIQWAGGNESVGGETGEAMDRMARLAYEMDGTREFHRTSPYGGAIHNYDSYWGQQDLDVTLQMMAPFMGEFGYASSPNLRSVHRYLPKEEWDVLPEDHYAKTSFHYHMPRFNEWKNSEDRFRLERRVNEMYDCKTLEHWIIGTQLAQTEMIRHAIENYRTNWPNSTGICYYKLTDVYPACSWSTIDYYGVPKISYDFIRNSYRNLHAAMVFNSLTAHPSILGAPDGVRMDRNSIRVPADCPEFFGRFANNTVFEDRTFTYNFVNEYAPSGLDIPEASKMTLRFTVTVEEDWDENAALRIPLRVTFPGYWKPGTGEWLNLRYGRDEIILSEDYWGDKALATKAFRFEKGKSYTFEVNTTATSAELLLNGEKILSATGFMPVAKAKCGIGQYKMPAFALTDCGLIVDGKDWMKAWNLDVPVYLLDDAGDTDKTLAEVTVRAYNDRLEEIRSQVYVKPAGESMSTLLDRFTLAPEECDCEPLFITLDVTVNGKLCDRTFYFLSTRYKPSCLFDRPQTKLAYTVIGEGEIEVRNVGTLPAIGVTAECPDKDDAFSVDEGNFWLNVGESRVLKVSHTDGLVIKAWNAPEI